MLRILILLLFVLSATAFAQTKNTPKAWKFDEFEAQANGAIDARMSNFFTELDETPTSQGVIINYGTEREIARRERIIRAYFQRMKFEAARFTMVNGGFNELVKTELWIVPAGADNPQPDSTARKFDEYGKIPSGEFKARMDNFYVELGNNPDSKGYILLFGSAQTIAREEKRIRIYLNFRNLDPARITFKNGGSDKSGKTEFWVIKAKPKIEPKTKIYIVPPGAKPPTQ